MVSTHSVGFAEQRQTDLEKHPELEVTLELELEPIENAICDAEWDEDQARSRKTAREVACKLASPADPRHALRRARTRERRSRSVRRASRTSSSDDGPGDPGDPDPEPLAAGRPL